MLLLYGGFAKKGKTNLCDLTVTVCRCYYWAVTSFMHRLSGGFNKNFVVHLLNKLIILTKAKWVDKNMLANLTNLADLN